MNLNLFGMDESIAIPVIATVLAGSLALLVFVYTRYRDGRKRSQLGSLYVACKVFVATALVVVLVSVALGKLWPGEGDGGTDLPSPGPGWTGNREEASNPRQPSQNAEDSPAPTVSVPENHNTIQWDGSVRIGENGPDLDPTPPETVDFFADVDLALVNPPRLSGNENALAVWRSEGMPTRKQCHDLVTTQGVTYVEASPGLVVCILTDDERTAVLTLTSISNSFNTGVLAHATVWENTEQ